jgi:thiosulfate/3-mercaptopyruvate sulfurtransferase
MRKSMNWFVLAIASCLLLGQTLAAGSGNLVTVQWLEKNLGRDDMLLIDASPAQLYAAKHIPGAINVDVFGYAGRELPVAEMERRLQDWGISTGKKIVLYDEGGSMTATRVFFDLYYYGVPAADLAILDGGLAKWQAAGGAVTKEPTPAPNKGSFRITKTREDARVRLPEFINASGDPKRNALIEALDPNYHFGELKFFDRAGHVPHGILLPSSDFYNEDKTFKSPDEIARMLAYLGIRPEQQVHSYCGGGVAATVPFFALKFLLNYPRVTVYKESQLEWLRDDRGLPFWTYDAPFMTRDANWLNGWGGPMVRFYGVSNLSVIDVRPAASYQLGHVPFALNVPAEVFRNTLSNPAKLAEILGPAGVNAAHEAVIVSDGGLNPSSALAFLMLEQLGQNKVSVLMDSVDEWGLRGFPLTKDPTVVGPRKTPKDIAVPATNYPPKLRPGIVINDPSSTKGQYPKVFVASGKNMSAKARDGKVVHVPYTDLLNADGTPKPAKDIWNILVKAGVPRYAEIITFADDPGEAAVNYFILKLMGYPDIKVLAQN